MSLLIPIRDLNPYKRFPLVTVGLIAANVVAFFAVAQGLAINDEAAFRYGAVPCDILDRCPALPGQVTRLIESRPELYSIFSSMFMHGDILHLGFNMLFLWVFGNNIEDRLGHVRYAIFYVLCGVAAAYAHILVNPASFIPTVGASGAISGILGGYLILWPAATIVSLVPLGFFFFSIRTPAWISLGLWFALQLLGGAAGLGRIGEGGGVAYLAHIGGFVAGMLLIVPFGGRRKEPRVVDAAGDGGRRLWEG
jgi:membrane associated rhomboid family serine protease